MAVNRERPHVFVLPEDDANRQLANGFSLERDGRQLHILPVAGGWTNVCESFEKDHVRAMRNYPLRSMILLIDFDEDPERRRYVGEKVPADLADRVFVVGAWSNPESLRRDLGASYEEIGRAIARDCRSQERATLGVELLKHNRADTDRLCVVFAEIS